LQRISAAFGRLYEALAGAAALMLLAMVAVVTADIVLRNLGRTGFSWADEVSEYALYLITMCTAPWLLRRGQHVRIDIVLTLVPPPVAWGMEAIADVIGFAVCLILARYGAGMTFDSWRLGAITIKNLVFPEFWLLAPLPLCFILLAAEFVLRLHRLITGAKTRRIEATSLS
jgi:TRAP-type C4-dicarboxylate transport system permease small subunit